MAWEHLSVNKPHLVYIILGGFTSLFMLCSSFIKERLYIGEATVATICGIIFGPHAANLINPLTWGNTDQITLEFSRIVLVVQCFAVGVELPKYYMEKHWRSVVFLLIPVMTFGWLITSLFIWWMIPTLNWLESLCVAACVTATDPVLASSVVGKGKFAKRVPKHLRDILSAESGCNDGMAFPFIYLALYLIDYRPHADEVSFHWIVLTILYECVFGAVYGFIIGYIGRHGIKYAERKDLVDRESFLVFYFVLALFCAGSGSILGVDDLLVGFAAGVGFSNDGWFTQKTEESHVSNVIDLLLNLAYFVYLGTIIPWEQYNNPSMGITPWRLVVIAIFVIFFRRIPIMMALKPLIPDIKTWREALFAGHFGPIGVGAIFVAILARAELETGGTTPLSEYVEGEHNYVLVYLIWPITTFLVIASIIVHGSSIAVFTLGKHINTLTLTMSYTSGQPGDDGPGWLNRLPRITSTSRSQAKSYSSETDADEMKLEDLPPGMLPPIGIAGSFLRRQKEEDTVSPHGSRASSLIPRRRKKKWDDGRGPGGPISQSAIYPQRRRSESADQSKRNSDTLTPGDSSPDNVENEVNERELGEVQHDPEMAEILHRQSNEGKRDQHKSDAECHPGEREAYQEGSNIIIENEDGDVLEVKDLHKREELNRNDSTMKENLEHPTRAYKDLRKKLGVWRHKDEVEGEDSAKPKKGKAKMPLRKRGPALAYQFGNTIIVEDEDGEVVKTYELPSSKQAQKAQPSTGESPKNPDDPQAESSSGAVRQGLARMGTWGFGGKGTSSTPEKPKRSAAAEDEEEDDKHIRFTIGGAGRRLTKEDFLRELQTLDPKARCEVITQSDAPEEMKDLAKRDANKNVKGDGRVLGARATQAATGKGVAKGVGREMARSRGAEVDSDEEDEDYAVRRRKAQGALDLSKKKGGADVPITEKATPNSSNDDSTGKGKGLRSTDAPESEVERRRRAQALKGVDDITPAQRGRGAVKEEDEEEEGEEEVMESAAEKRRREAALRGGGGEDSEDDDTPRVPPPVAKRGIRFAQSPERGRRGGRVA